MEETITEEANHQKEQKKTAEERVYLWKEKVRREMRVGE